MQCMYSSDSRGSGGHNGRGEGSFNRHGGRGGGRSSVQCQVCFKYSHMALTCYNRFNPQYQASNSGNYGFNGNSGNRSNWSQNQNQKLELEFKSELEQFQLELTKIKILHPLSGNLSLRILSLNLYKLWWLTLTLLLLHSSGRLGSILSCDQQFSEHSTKFTF